MLGASFCAASGRRLPPDSCHTLVWLVPRWTGQVVPTYLLGTYVPTYYSSSININKVTIKYYSKNYSSI
ncbi:hypothetical protein CCM_06682 [Cordyceps militaris CM01]|uniref:Uncharacterized protein n=1 Tax=Cordyceps militaris (strain CM01) TaxID=983644 RepID=G3JN81_CORMM|nr:uncharacterized protein CCM_06682 [Cordyceps militaris CM01]EGX90263.1 hypothetical protein CCM_06682 [Cordyceps militaris CM01]